MVRQMLWLFISVMISHPGLAKDPFDKTRRQRTTQAAPVTQYRTPTSPRYPAPSPFLPPTSSYQLPEIGFL